MREVHIQLLLDLVDRLEKAPGHDRYDHPDDRDHNKQADKRPAPEGRIGLLSGQLGRSLGVGHELNRYGHE